MRYLQNIVFAFILPLVILPGGCVQEGAKKPAIVAETILDRLQNEGQTAFNTSDYPTALEKWQLGLEQARILEDKQYSSQFLRNIGVAYQHLGQSEQALQYYKQALEIRRTLGNKHDEGVALRIFGDTCLALGRPQEAAKYHKQALDILRRLGDRREEGEALTSLGVAYDHLAQYSLALESYQQALKLHRAIKNKRGEGKTLTSIGTVYTHLAQYPQALDYYERALEIQREIDDKQGEGMTLTSIGGVYEHLGQPQQALNYCQQALEIQRAIEDNHGEEFSLRTIAMVYKKLSQEQQAWEYSQQSREVQSPVRDTHEGVDRLTGIGAKYKHLGQYRQALKHYEQALEILRATGNKLGEGNLLNRMGMLCELLARYQQALEYLQQCLEIGRVIGDKRGEGNVLTSIGVVHERLGQYYQALNYYKQALEIHQDIGDKPGEGITLGAIGMVYHSLGYYQQSLEYGQQALEINRAMGNKNGEATSLNTIAGAYAGLGQYPQAQEYSRKVLEIRHALGDQQGESIALSDSAMLSEEPQQALAYLQQALETQRAIGDKRGEGRTLARIGIVHGYLEDYEQTLAYLQQALKIQHIIGDKPGEGNSLTIIGATYERLGQYQEASTVLQESIQINKTIGATERLWMAQCNLALVEVRLGRPESAVTLYEQALDTIEILRAGLTKKELKLSFMRGRVYVYDELIDLLQELHKKHPEKGYDRKALEIFERKQGRLFLEEMGQSGARLFAGLPEDIPQRERDLEFQLEQTHTYLAEERSKPITEQNKERLRNLEEREQILRSEQKTLHTTIKAEYPEYYALRYPKPASLADLQQHVLQLGELLLVYNVMEEKTMLWLISPDMMKMYTLPVGEEILQEKVAELRRVMEIEWKRNRGRISLRPEERPQTTFAQVSHELYTLLVPKEGRPLLTEERTLNIVPTGPLYALPFEALGTNNPASTTLDRRVEVHYLIEDIPISYLSSVSLLKTLREAQTRRQGTAPYPLLAFAHPVYAPSLNPSQEGDISFPALRSQLYHDFFRGTFQELPETAEEAKEIKTLLNAPDNTAPLQLREKASRENVFAFNTDKRLDDYQYVVFASHGVLPEQSNYVTQPALVLSYPEQNGYLTMADVFQLQLNAKLVSLSACNTGGGEQVRGEGVMGLTRAFMYAGTPAIAVTLWSVETFSAKALDVGLFEHLNTGQPPADALRAIKLQMLRGEKGEEYRHPYYWAPFVLFGDGK